MNAVHTAARSQERGDFTVDSRLLLISGMAAVVGTISAFVAYALVWLIGVLTNLFYFHRYSSRLVSPAGHQLGAWAVLIPVAGGLIIGLMARYGSEKIRGHGIPEALEAILIGQSRMSPKVAILKPISSALSIGTGGPFGAEGPIIMTGGAFGSLFAQAFHLSAVERKTLLVAGASAGMAAIFATPLAALLLAVELLLFEWKPRSFIPVAMAVTIAWAIRIPLFGAGPLMPMAPQPGISWQDLLAALGLGLVVGFASSLLTLMVYGFEDLFHRLPLHFMWWPAIGGLAVGLGGLLQPRALGVGYDVMPELLNGRLIGAAALGFLLVKAVIWAFALGSGTSGGVLAPLLLMGGAIGALAGPWLPDHDPGRWAMIGMAAMMGGTMRAPMTGVVFLLELTGEIRPLPGLLIGCVAADLVTVLLLKRSILTEKVARRGHHVAQEYGVNPLSRLRVGAVMEANPPTIPAGMTLASLLGRLEAGDAVLGRREAWLIVSETGTLAGLVTRGDLARAMERGHTKDANVLSIAVTQLVVTDPDELLEDAVGRMVRYNVGRLPVVSPDDPSRLLGYLGRPGIAEAWRRASDEEHRREPGWLSASARLFRLRARRILGLSTGEFPTAG